MNQDNNNVINFQNQFNNEPVYAKFDNRVLALLKDWLHMWWVVFVWYTLFFIIKVVLQANDVEISDIFTVLHISVPILFLVFGQPLYSFICGVSIYYIVFYLCTFLYKGVPKMSHPFECLYNKEGARNSHPPYLK